MVVAVFRNEVDARFQNLLGRKSGDIPAVQDDLAAKRLVASENCADQLRSTRADNTRDAENLARIQIEVDIAEAIAAEITNLQHGLQLIILNRHVGLRFLPVRLRVIRQKTLNQHFLGEILDRSFQRDDAVAHNRHMRRNLEYLGQAVRDIDEGNALLLQILNRLKQSLHFVEGQGAGRFVQNQNLRIAHQTTQKLNELLLRDGQRACLALKVEVKAQLLHADIQTLFQLAFILIEAHQDVFQNRHVREEHRLLRHQIDAVCQRCGRLSELNRFSVNEDIALITGVDAHDNLHQRGFAGAVAADQRDNLARVHTQVDSLEHDVLPERLANPLHLKAGRILFRGHISILLRYAFTKVCSSHNLLLSSL